MKKNIKKFKNRETLLQFLRQQLIFEPEISILLSEEELEVVKDIEDELEPIEYSKEINSDEYVYLIEKYVDKQEKTHLFVQPIELDESFVVKIHIENDVIIVLENLLEPECSDKIVAEDELLLVDYEEDTVENEEDSCCQGCKEVCESCKCNDCHNYGEENYEDEDEDVVDEYLEVKVDDFIKDLIKHSKDEDFCFYCKLKELLEDVYSIAQKDGVNSAYLSLSDMLQKVVED